MRSLEPSQRRFWCERRDENECRVFGLEYVGRTELRADPEPPTSNIAGRIRIAQSLRANHAYAVVPARLVVT